MNQTWTDPELFPTVQQLSPNNAYQTYGAPAPAQHQNPAPNPYQNHQVPAPGSNYGQEEEEDDEEEDPYAGYRAYPPQYHQPNYYPGAHPARPYPHGSAGVRSPRYSRGADEEHGGDGGEEKIE